MRPSCKLSHVGEAKVLIDGRLSEAHYFCVEFAAAMFAVKVLVRENEYRVSRSSLYGSLEEDEIYVILRLRVAIDRPRGVR